jgi:hypothetical protein
MTMLPTATGGAPLSDLFRVRRRYARSVNLERDLDAPGGLEGYVASSLAVATAERILDTWVVERAPKAWTITGVYGTGKSAFAHFLSSLLAPDGRLRAEAYEALTRSSGEDVARKWRETVPDGHLRAIVTAQREPLAVAVLRALDRGAERFWRQRSGRRPPVIAELHALTKNSGTNETLPGSRIVDLALDLARAAGGVFLIVDELGKCLEHAARGLGGEDDVYLLQQLAEATAEPGVRLGFAALLHQGFGEYASGLALDRRAEWLKVQGRFEDVPFAESPDQMLTLIGSAIERESPSGAEAWARESARSWTSYLNNSDLEGYVGEALSEEVVCGVLPLHPLTALVLPSVCTKYAQNDRSLFTFLASREPHAFGHFLSQRRTHGGFVPLQRLDDVYDYFAGIAGQALGFRPQFQRWAEVHAVVSDVRTLDPDSVATIKTVAVLNLIASSGPLRASRGLVIASLTMDPRSDSEYARWGGVLDQLAERGLVTYRRQFDEYRLWEGSEFDVEAAIRSRAMAAAARLSTVLDEAVPLNPLVAQRHSYETGTLRYFERRYTESPEEVAAIERRDADSDGVLLYWIGNAAPPAPLARTSDDRPVVVVEAREVAALGDAAAEYGALADIARSEPHLQRDGVARREVQYRLRIARAALDHAVREALYRAPLRCWVEGGVEELGAAQLRARLSLVCRAAYPQSLVLWNELINRRQLTVQGATARRYLIEAMLRSPDQPRLGLVGHGPETSMYESVLRRSGIHREEGGRWCFGKPTSRELAHIWDAIVDSIVEAGDRPKSIGEIFSLLENPPFGIKRGVLPVLVAAVLLADKETLGVYREGSFLPTLGAEHFEILVRHPDKFAVKYFALDGLRSEVIRDLTEVVGAAGPRIAEARNAGLLGLVSPLVRFATSLPPATVKTATLSPVALAVRDLLRKAPELDSLLFSELPAACDLPPITPGESSSPERSAAFRSALLGALRELHTFHERRREECRRILHSAFGISPDPRDLRADLRRRTHALANRPLEERLRAFVAAAADPAANESNWLESLIMIVGDRPLKTWTDQDADGFEARASDFARRFANLEDIPPAAARGGVGDDVRRITITGPDGRDVNRLVWIEGPARENVNATVQELTRTLRALPRGEREAALVLLTETLLGGGPGTPADIRAAASAELNPQHTILELAQNA